tara:strand:+ start:817 stop:3525 length:2709 start_codon:yes stop_codon:yes gene_type:complete
MARKKLKLGGLTKGKSHSKGGIDMVVKSTNQRVELEGGEGVLNKYVMSSEDKYEFEGKEKTACEIASNLNQETGNGVKFECEDTKNTDMTPTDASTGFAKGGKVGMIECQNCGWDWKVSDGGDDLYICHKCNADNEFAKGGDIDGDTKIVIRNIKNPNERVKGVKSIYRGSYAKVFKILNADSVFGERYATDYENLDGNDFYFEIDGALSPIEEEKINALKDVEIMHEYAKGGKINSDSLTQEQVPDGFSFDSTSYSSGNIIKITNIDEPPKYGQFTDSDLSKVIPRVIGGVPFGAMFKVDDTANNFRFIKGASELKSFPTETIQSMNGNKYLVSKSKKTRYGTELFALGKSYYSGFVNLVLKGIKSPIFIGDVGYYSKGWTAIDGISGIQRGVAGAKLTDYNYKQKGEAKESVIKMFSLSWLRLIKDPKSKVHEIFKKYNVELSLVEEYLELGYLIISLDAALTYANRVGETEIMNPYILDKKLDLITDKLEKKQIFTSIGVVHPELCIKAGLDSETFGSLSNELLNYLNSKEYANLYIDYYDTKVVEEVVRRNANYISPSFELSNKVAAPKGVKKAKFDRKDALLNSNEAKEIATLQNLMEIFKDSPNAIKEMNKAVRDVERKSEMELNLEGREHYNLKKSFSSYFDITSRAYVGKSGKRTQAFAPNGERSDLTTKQYDIVRSSEFLEWFGNWEFAYETKNYNAVSKAMDENFEPTIVFHGTMPDNEFFKFKFEKFPVMYFSEDKYYSEFFAKETNKSNTGLIFEFYLNVRNPLDMTEFGIDKMSAQDLIWVMYEKFGIELDIDKVPKKVVDDAKLPFWAWARKYNSLGLSKFFSEITRYGYDGIKYIEDNPQWKHKGEKAVTMGWMVFDAKQVKLADGRNTTFSSFREDFRFNKGGNVT